MRRISLNRYAAISYLDEFEDHFLTLKMHRMEFYHAPHMKLWSKKKIKLVLLQIRRITQLTYGVSLSRLHQKQSKTTEGHAPHKDSSYAASKGGV